MIEGLPAEWLAQGSAVTILGITVLGVLRGWLVPGRSLEQMLTLHAERLAEAHTRGDEWRQIAETAIAAGAEKDRQIEQLLEVGRTTNALLEGLRAASDGAGR